MSLRSEDESAEVRKALQCDPALNLRPLPPGPLETCSKFLNGMPLKSESVRLQHQTPNVNRRAPLCAPGQPGVRRYRQGCDKTSSDRSRGGTQEW